MKNRELIDYFKTFSEDSDVAVVIISAKTNEAYSLEDYIGITDTEHPVFFLKIDKQLSSENDSQEVLPC